MRRHYSAVAVIIMLNWVMINSVTAQTPRAVEVVHSEELVSAQRGAVPVVLSVPHGGMVAIPGAEQRTHGRRGRDVATEELALMVAQELTVQLEGKPYYAIAQFSRRYVDANRGPGFQEEEAYESALARVHYDAYHRALREYVDEVREKFGAGILIDIHGQSSRPGLIVRGTVRGETVTAMLERHGLEALIGPRSIFGQLHEMGYEVAPAVHDAPDSPEDEAYLIGGYIVRAYGSHHPDGIDAIQVELGRDLRRDDVRRQTAHDLAHAIAVYVRTYIYQDVPADSAEVEDQQPDLPVTAE